MWFHHSHLHKYESIYLNDLHGYVLPHAGTKYTGNIISHTLRFKPTKSFSKIFIIYLPSSNEPNVIEDNNSYYHEYYVPWKSLQYFFGKNIEYIGINVLEDNNLKNYDNNSIYVISADFSHFLPFHQAVELENKAAKSILFKNLQKTNYNNIIDHTKSFTYLNKILPQDFNYQWVGRTRSEGFKGVGYLSFLIRDQSSINNNKISGIFVTVYDKNMNTRECLGEWFTKNKPWNNNIQNKLIQKVCLLGETESRLTNGQFLNIPLSNYTITYLYRKRTKEMIRGWHSIKMNAFYLSDVFLENTHSNGKWFTSDDIYWKKGKFLLHDTFKKLNKKSGIYSKSQKYILYESNVIHKQIT